MAALAVSSREAVLKALRAELSALPTAASLADALASRAGGRLVEVSAFFPRFPSSFACLFSVRMQRHLVRQCGGVHGAGPRGGAVLCPDTAL